MKYLIDVPPPTISGLLHMGHVFSYCHMDFIARYHNGQALFRTPKLDLYEENHLVYPFCFDCNGLPTEKLAQKSQIYDQKEIIKFARNTSVMYADLFQKIGMGWSNHNYHSFDKNAVKLAELSFQDLVDKGYAYKATTEYFYCPLHKVSVSQAEIDDEGKYERSGEKVEVRTGEGWFINMKDHLPQIREMIDKIEWKPDVFRLRLHRWLDDLKYDWSISRERNYGIHIPGEPENVVFDTWFTSSLSPQMTWTSETYEPELACPVLDVRFQAHDIVRTWALFTIVKSLYHNNQIPWKTIVISGHALDAHGKKISKSAGNFVPPEKFIDQYSMNGVRYWAAQNQIGTDSRIDTQAMSKGNKLVNKLKNACYFLNGAGKWGIEDWEEGQPEGAFRDDLYEEWLKINESLHESFVQYDWPKAIQTLTTYFWHRFCDELIEECKKNPCYETLNDIFWEMISWYEIFFPNIREIAKEVVRRSY